MPAIDTVGALNFKISYITIKQRDSTGADHARYISKYLILLLNPLWLRLDR